MELLRKIPRRCPKCGCRPLLGLASAFCDPIYCEPVKAAPSAAWPPYGLPEIPERLEAICIRCRFRIKAMTVDAGEFEDGCE